MLKRCPFCDNGMSSFAGITPDAFAKGEGTFAINCDCGATGPLEPTMQEAVDAWNTRAPAQEAPAPVAWRLTDGEGDYEYLTEEPSDQSRAWSRRYGREWEPLYASPVSSSPSEPAQLMWQPFETAPKDGTWIIARCNDHSRMFRISWGRAQNGDMCWCTSESIISYGDGLFSPNGGWTPCPTSQLPSTELCCPGGCMFTPCKVSPATRGGEA